MDNMNGNYTFKQVCNLLSIKPHDLVVIRRFGIVRQRPHNEYSNLDVRALRLYFILSNLHVKNSDIQRLRFLEDELFGLFAKGNVRIDFDARNSKLLFYPCDASNCNLSEEEKLNASYLELRIRQQIETIAWPHNPDHFIERVRQKVIETASS